MPQAAATRFSEGPASIDGVEIFAAGTWRDKSYTPTDLQAMADNFRRFSAGAKPLLRVPGVLGHEEQQDILNRSDLPAAAWAKRLYVEPRAGRDGVVRPTLLADFEDVPPEVAKLLKSKAYRTVSAEIYDKPPEGIPAQGKMLRRVAFLGGDIPQLKVLNDIPQPRSHSEAGYGTLPAFISFRESRPRSPGADSTWVFSEVSPMDRQAMIQALQQKGFDASMLTDAVPDPVLAEMVRVCGASGQGSGFDDMANVPPPKDDAEKAAYRERAKKYFDRAKRFADHCGFGAKMKFGDEADTTTTSKKEPDGDEKFSERMKAIEAKIEQAHKFAEQRLADEKRAAITTRVRALQESGKVLPAERDGIISTAEMLDAAKVQKFTENGREVERTALDNYFATLEARPKLLTYAERMKQGAGGTTAEDAEVAKVEDHYETFREQFTKVGQPKDTLISAFREYRKLHPDTTAAEFLNQ